MIFPPKRVQIRNVQWKLLLLNYVGLKKKKKELFQYYFYASLEQCKIVLYIYVKK